MSTHGHPVIDAAWDELRKTHCETGGGDGLNPNTSPEYAGALRVFRAALDAHRDIICERRTARLTIVK